MTSLKKERRAQIMRPIASDDLLKLQSLAARVCDEIGANRSSLKGALILDTLVAMYRAGVRDERLLLTCVSKRMPAKQSGILNNPKSRSRLSRVRSKECENGRGIERS